MPEISSFLGIVIYMYYRDHAPPHFHAIYGEYEIVVEIESGVGFLGERSRQCWSGTRFIKMNYWRIGSLPNSNSR